MLAVAAVPLAEHTGLAGSKPAPVRCEFKYKWVVGTEHQRRHRREVERCAGGVAVGLQAEVARSGDLALQLLLWPLKKKKKKKFGQSLSTGETRGPRAWPT